MATIRFYEELNRYLEKKHCKRDISLTIDGSVSVKKVIEDLGVPHTEVDMILVNGESVDFSHPVSTRDRISVYSVFESFDIKETSRVRPAPLRETRFVLDVHLGTLTRWLRRLGFDSLYSNQYEDETIARISAEEKRILLTKDRGLLKRKIVTRGFCIKSSSAIGQVREVISRFQLESSCHPFTRCLRCNEALIIIDKGKIRHQLPVYVRERYDEFKICMRCSKVYWKGTHWESMRRQLLDLKRNA